LRHFQFPNRKIVTESSAETKDAFDTTLTVKLFGQLSLTTGTLQQWNNLPCGTLLQALPFLVLNLATLADPFLVSGIFMIRPYVRSFNGAAKILLLAAEFG